MSLSALNPSRYIQLRERTIATGKPAMFMLAGRWWQVDRLGYVDLF